MRNKIINPNTVTHIYIFKETEGVKGWMGIYSKRIWREKTFFKFLWLFKTPWVTFEEGYWRTDCREYSTPFKLDEDRHFVKDGSVWSFPNIVIYSSEKEIHTEYFFTMMDLEYHLKAFYPNVSVRYK